MDAEGSTAEVRSGTPLQDSQLRATRILVFWGAGLAAGGVVGAGWALLTPSWLCPTGTASCFGSTPGLAWILWPLAIGAAMTLLSLLGASGAVGSMVGASVLLFFGSWSLLSFPGFFWIPALPLLLGGLVSLVAGGLVFGRNQAGPPLSLVILGVTWSGLFLVAIFVGLYELNLDQCEKGLTVALPTLLTGGNCAPPVLSTTAELTLLGAGAVGIGLALLPLRAARARAVGVVGVALLAALPFLDPEMDLVLVCLQVLAAFALTVGVSSWLEFSRTGRTLSDLMDGRRPDPAHAGVPPGT